MLHTIMLLLLMITLPCCWPTLLVPPTAWHAYTIIPSLLASRTCAHHCRPELLHSPGAKQLCQSSVPGRSGWAEGGERRGGKMRGGGGRRRANRSQNEGPEGMRAPRSLDAPTSKLHVHSRKLRPPSLQFCNDHLSLISDQGSVIRGHEL